MGIRGRMGAAALLALLLVFAGVLAAAGQGTPAAGQIILTTTPPAAEIIPDEVEAPTKFTIEARGPQGALRNAILDFEITAPASGPFVSTDIPVIEGTTLLKNRFPAPEGKVEFDFVLPIRGTYNIKVQALPAPGATFQPITQQLTLDVKERGAEIGYFWLTMAGLLGVGVLAGFVLGYANRGARAA